MVSNYIVNPSLSEIPYLGLSKYAGMSQAGHLTDIDAMTHLRLPRSSIKISCGEGSLADYLLCHSGVIGFPQAGETSNCYGSRHPHPGQLSNEVDAECGISFR